MPDMNNDMNNDINDATIANLLTLQAGGPQARQAAAAFLADIGPFVRERATRELRKRLVHGPDGGDDLAAIDDVTSEISLRMVRLEGVDRRIAAGHRGGRFVPGRGVGGVEGLRRWLSRLTGNEVVTYCRQNRSAGRRVKIRSTTDLDLNPTYGNGSPLDRMPAKFVRPDLLPILDECIAQLPDDLRTLVRLKLDEGLSLRATAVRQGRSPTTVFRGLQEAFAILRPMLEARGIDESWFGGQAA